MRSTSATHRYFRGSRVVAVNLPDWGHRLMSRFGAIANDQQTKLEVLAQLLYSHARICSATDQFKWCVTG